MARKAQTETNAAPIEDNASQTEASEKPATEGGNIISPIAVGVLLRSNHPHDSYGRIGRRFNKETEVVIPFDELTHSEHLALGDDVWLEVTYITED